MGNNLKDTAPYVHAKNWKDYWDRINKEIASRSMEITFIHCKPTVFHFPLKEKKPKYCFLCPMGILLKIILFFKKSNQKGGYKLNALEENRS